MVPCHCCWSIKEVGKALKSSFGVAIQTTKRDNFYGKEKREFYYCCIETLL